MNATFDPGPEYNPLVSQSLRLLQELGEEVFFLLDHGNFGGTRQGVVLVEEMRLVPQKDVHALGGSVQHISGVFIKIPLKVKDLFWPGQQSSLECLCGRPCG